MANKNLFGSNTRTTAPVADTTNEAGGIAYSFTDEHALAQYAVTGCLNGTYYASAETQLSTVLDLSKKVSPEFLAKLAVYAREEGLMKDMPALLLAILSTRGEEGIALTKRVFTRVCNDAKMVKNFVQIVRSGQTGRKSLGTALKRLVQNWLNSRTEEQLFNAVVGQDPSLSDVIKMVHPKPATKAREVFYKYLIGKDLTKAETKKLPANVRAYELFKAEKGGKEVPEVPFMLLTNLELTTEQYRELAEGMSWSALRQNLNALAKHKVFDSAPLTKKLAAKLADPVEVRKANALPFQLFASFNATQNNADVPAQLKNAIQDAMEAALTNVPEVPGDTFVAVDISGSMGSPATGNRGTATSTVSCLEAAAVMGSALLRRNPNNVEIIPFSDNVVTHDGPMNYYYSRTVAGGTPRASGNKVNFNGRDSVITNVNKLRALPSGGTNCSSVLRHLNERKVKGASAVIYLSDNQSWVDSNYTYGQGTATMQEWNEFRKRNPNAKLVCIDIQPYGTSQAKERPDVLNVGGFSDNVFTVVDLFLRNELTSGHWTGKINEVKI